MTEQPAPSGTTRTLPPPAANGTAPPPLPTAQVPRRGRRWLDTQRFQLFRFVKFILRALEWHYGSVSELSAVAAARP